MRVWNVGIVGGGPGGLLTAYFLQEMASRPLRVTLFEASPRLGGKLLTPRFNTANLRYEAGAAEFYDYSAFGEDPLKELVLELGLSIRPMGGASVILNNRILSNLDDVRDNLGPQALQELHSFNRRARDQMLPREFYHSDFPDGAKTASPNDGAARFHSVLESIRDPETRRYVECLIHSDLATEPEKTTPAYGLQNYLMNDPAYMQLYGIDGGNEQLAHELIRRVNARMLVEHAVASIVRNQDGSLRVASNVRGEHRTDDFDFLVVALPHRHLSAVKFLGGQLPEAVRRHLAQYDHPAHYLRMTLLFDRPFWRKHLSESYWMLDQFGGCCLYDESSRQPECEFGILGWLLGGSAAQEMSHLPDEQLIENALGSLPSFLSEGRERFVEGRVHRWIGAVNAIPGGIVPENLDRRHRPEPIDHSNLFFVGDYLFDSTLNGVLDSADYVAAWIASLMSDLPAKNGPVAKGRAVHPLELEPIIPSPAMERRHRASNSGMIAHER